MREEREREGGGRRDERGGERECCGAGGLDAGGLAHKESPVKGVYPKQTQTSMTSLLSKGVCVPHYELHFIQTIISAGTGMNLIS